MCSLLPAQKEEEQVAILQPGDHLWQRSEQLVAGLQMLSSKLDTIRDTHHHHHHLDMVLLEAANPMCLNFNFNIISHVLAHFHAFL
jgi:hypothetical protein